MNKQWVFVVASHRSGTNMLLNMLNSIQGVNNLGEVVQVTFNNPKDEEETSFWRKPLLKEVFGKEAFPKYIEPQWLLWSSLPDEDSVKTFIHFLINHEGYENNDSKLARHYNTFVGKLLFQHCPPYYYNLWKWLYKSPVKIIYLHRTDLLQICVSAENALRTKQWYVPSYTKVEPQLEHFELPVDRVLRQFSFLRMCEEFFGILTRKSTNAITVNYDHLVQNWSSETDRILNHLQLDIPPETILPRSKKQIHNHRSLITNYDELTHYFRNTPYEQYFL